MKHRPDLLALVVIQIIFFTELGNSFRNSLPRRRKDSNNKDSKRVYLGIPLLYQKRQELARELGINPYTIGSWNDLMYQSPQHPFENVERDEVESLDNGSNNNFLRSAMHRSNRKKRGIIWNKIKKLKKGISMVKKKIWKIKEKAMRIVKGKNHATPKPSYPSTGGSWGWTSNSNKANYGQTHSLSSSHGPPYGGYGASSSSTAYGVSVPISGSSAASSSYYGPHHEFQTSNYGGSRVSSDYEPFSTNHESYGPPIDNDPNYAGIAVRSRFSRG